MEIARDIATNVAPMSAALSKRLLWDTAINGYTPRQVASLETQLHHRVMGTDDAREGVNAYLERRAPRFSARLSADWAPTRSGAVSMHIELTADGLGFTEGPVWLPDDRVALTSISHGCVYIVDPLVAQPNASTPAAGRTVWRAAPTGSCMSRRTAASGRKAVPPSRAFR